MPHSFPHACSNVCCYDSVATVVPVAVLACSCVCSTDLLVFDFARVCLCVCREHSVVMRAGDMLLYESAKLLHGRPDVFLGRHYDNVFIHYKPVSGWDYDWI